MSRSDFVVGVALVLALLVPALLDFALSRAGFTGLGGWVWALGYGLVVVTVWLVWIRHIEFDPEGQLRP
ncbi:MAG: hypothetical protein ABEJ06_04045 [Haloarculaceae archaeon]